jgi:hypothetical protein
LWHPRSIKRPERAAWWLSRHTGYVVFVCLADHMQAAQFMFGSGIVKLI